MKILAKILILVMFFAVNANANVPITTDSRIKTYVFSENEVYKLTVYFGYQSNIEFAKNEEIQTVSMGDSFAWQVTPMGRRLFIKPLEKFGHTNMTVITNKRSYQFDVVAKEYDLKNKDELVYVIRFFYPDENKQQLDALGIPSNLTMPNDPSAIPMMAMPESAASQIGKRQYFAPPTALPDPPIAAPKAPSTTPSPNAKAKPQSKQVEAPVLSNSKYNYDYTLSGSESFAPLMIFDDGKSTFFEFPANIAVPEIYSLNDKKAENKEKAQKQGKYIVISSVSNKFILKNGAEKVTVFNEAK